MEDHSVFTDKLFFFFEEFTDKLLGKGGTHPSLMTVK
jgi:hypothetical protein